MKRGKEAKCEKEEQRGNTHSNNHHLHRVRDGVVGDDARPVMVLSEHQPTPKRGR
jgi:hypothetical protein